MTAAQQEAMKAEFERLFVELDESPADLMVAFLNEMWLQKGSSVVNLNKFIPEVQGIVDTLICG